MLWIVLLIVALTCVRMSLSIAEKRADPPNPHLRTTGEVLESFIIAVVVIFLVVRPFCLQPFYIPSQSMTPTLEQEDRVLVSKLSYLLGEPKRHEVAVFRAPQAATVGEMDGEEKDFIKRIVGLPGDIVEVRNGVTYVNGAPEQEPYVREPPNYDMPPTVIPPRSYFVMGDNRNHSNDSHHWGVLERNRLIGRATCIFWPPSRAGAIR